MADNAISATYVFGIKAASIFREEGEIFMKEYATMILIGILGIGIPCQQTSASVSCESDAYNSHQSQILTCMEEEDPEFRELCISVAIENLRLALARCELKRLEWLRELDGRWPHRLRTPFHPSTDPFVPTGEFLD